MEMSLKGRYGVKVVTAQNSKRAGELVSWSAVD